MKRKQPNQFNIWDDPMQFSLDGNTHVLGYKAATMAESLSGVRDTMRTALRQVWMRVGDQDDYHNFDSPHDAGYILGDILSVTGQPDRTPVRHGVYGIAIAAYQDMDYVSLYWGDKNAEPLAELTDTDLEAFESGIAEGATN